ncbi:MAG TPA: hypothetical protein DCE41_19730 [Cytophagales bacterium]|nr:hypothetical protein [Cytophagales bacterium]
MMVRLRRLGHQVVRLNLVNLLRTQGTLLGAISLSESNAMFTLEGETHTLSSFDVIWSRRFRHNFIINQLDHRLFKDLPPEVLPFLYKELEHMIEHLFTIIRSLGIRTINDYTDETINKLTQITRAKEAGLNAPEFRVVNTREGMKEALATWGSAITKPIFGLGYLHDQDKVYSTYTQYLEQDSLGQFPQRFFPSLIQQKVNVVSELKCLIVGDQLLAVEQLPDKEARGKDIKEAFRERKVILQPYTLPEEWVDKLLSLAKSFRVDLCSIDVLVTEEGEHYFLELNQDGIVAYYAQFHDQNLLDLLETYILHGKN